MYEYFVSKQQLSLLQDRINKAEETKASYELYDILGALYRNNNYEPISAMVVGAGGSYPAALKAAHSIRNQLRTPKVEAVTPQTALRILGQFDRIVFCTYKPKYDVIICISYSGKSPDIQAVYEKCKEMKDTTFVLLTGACKEDLKDIYEENEKTRIVSYFNPADTTGKERGMISMFSTLAPVIIFEDSILASSDSPRFYIYQECLKNGENFVSNLDSNFTISEIANGVRRVPVIHIMYEWKTLPTAADIESKIMESGIANVILHEKKNFSHGRYTMLYKQDFGLVINLVDYAVGIGNKKSKIIKFYNNDFDRILSQFLQDRCKEKSASYLEIGNGLFDPAEWNVEELSKLPYLVTVLGRELNVDISKPFNPNPFPEESQVLYKYKGEF